MAEETKDPRAVELGRLGGLARRSRQSPAERKAIARLGGMARGAKAAERREQASLLPTHVTELVPVTYEITPWEALRGTKIGDDPQGYVDRRWTPKLIRFFERCRATRAPAISTAHCTWRSDGGHDFDAEPRTVAPPGREMRGRCGT